MPEFKWWHLREPTDPIVPRPLLHPDTVAHFEVMLNKTDRVLEFGCGGSTLWLSERVRSVDSYDDSIRWIEEVGKVAKHNVTLTLDARPPAPEHKYDVLFIDGERGARIHWMNAAPGLVRPGGLVVVDNYNREEYAHAIAALKAVAKSWSAMDQKFASFQYMNTLFLRMPDGA